MNEVQKIVINLTPPLGLPALAGQLADLAPVLTSLVPHNRSLRKKAGGTVPAGLSSCETVMNCLPAEISAGKVGSRCVGRTH
jgi:hypothetical protein